jgi:hypothetical protein
MFSTVEVRWFGAGGIPPAVLAWFGAGPGEPAAQPRRVDAYLRLPDMNALGIKLREGRIEVKWRVRDYGRVHPHRRVAGRLEGWRKWSFALAAVSGESTDLPVPARSLIAVEKARQLRRYQLRDNGAVVPVPATSYPERGCDWELTAIRAANEAWWSLAFEAFGPVVDLRRTLSLVVELALAAGEPPVLEEDGSFGYPTWLARLASEE